MFFDFWFLNLFRILIVINYNDNLIYNRRQNSNIQFEASQFWIRELEEKIIDLGSRFRSGDAIHGTNEALLPTTVGINSKLSFPINIIIEELEEITSLAYSTNSSLDRSWIYR